MPSLAAACAASAAQRAQARSADEPSQPDSSGPLGCPKVDGDCTYYLVNPAGDLAATQITFEPWFRQLPGWQVCCSMQLVGRGATCWGPPQRRKSLRRFWPRRQCLTYQNPLPGPILYSRGLLKLSSSQDGLHRAASQWPLMFKCLLNVHVTLSKPSRSHHQVRRAAWEHRPPLQP